MPARLLAQDAYYFKSVFSTATWGERRMGSTATQVDLNRLDFRRAEPRPETRSRHGGEVTMTSLQRRFCVIFVISYGVFICLLHQRGVPQCDMKHVMSFISFISFISLYVI